RAVAPRAELGDAGLVDVEAPGVVPLAELDRQRQAPVAQAHHGDPGGLGRRKLGHRTDSPCKVGVDRADCAAFAFERPLLPRAASAAAIPASTAATASSAGVRSGEAAGAGASTAASAPTAGRPG